MVKLLIFLFYKILENMENKRHKNIDFEKSYDKIEVKLEKKCLQLFAF